MLVHAAETTDHTLYAATNDASLNLATSKAHAMTADELYQAGFDHGFKNRGMRGSLSSYPEYIRGWGEGYRSRF